MTHRIYLLSSALLLAGCSSAMSQEAANTAVVTQGGGGEYASNFDGSAPAPVEPILDGAPPVAIAPIAPIAPPVVVQVERVAPAPVVVKSHKFTCDIEVSRTSHGIRVTPVVHANRSLSGEYSLTVTKDGAGGSSDISQGGEFDAARGERVELSSSEFSMERGAKFRAVLKVRAGGHEVCRDIRS